jgi:hypothetical protein
MPRNTYRQQNACPCPTYNRTTATRRIVSSSNSSYAAANYARLNQAPINTRLSTNSTRTDSFKPSQAPVASSNSAQFTNDRYTLAANQKLKLKLENGAIALNISNQSGKPQTIIREKNRYGEYNYFVDEGKDKKNPLYTPEVENGFNPERNNTRDYSIKSDTRRGYNYYPYQDSRDGGLSNKRFSANDIRPKELDLKAGDQQINLYPTRMNSFNQSTLNIDGQKITINNKTDDFAYIHGKKQEDGSYKYFYSTENDSTEHEIKANKPEKYSEMTFDIGNFLNDFDMYKAVNKEQEKATIIEESVIPEKAPEPSPKKTPEETIKARDFLDQLFGVPPDTSSDSKKAGEEKTPTAVQNTDSSKTNNFNLNIFNFESPMNIDLKDLKLTKEILEALDALQKPSMGTKELNSQMDNYKNQKNKSHCLFFV